MSLTSHPRKERPHGSKKVSSHSKTGSAPRPFMQGISAFVAGAVFASWPKSIQNEWLALVKEFKEEEFILAQYMQYMMKQETVTTTTSTVYGPIPRMEGSYVVERVVQSESSRQQIVYLASGEGS